MHLKRAMFSAKCFLTSVASVRQKVQLFAGRKLTVTTKVRELHAQKKKKILLIARRGPRGIFMCGALERDDEESRRLLGFRWKLRGTVRPSACCAQDLLRCLSVLSSLFPVMIIRPLPLGDHCSAISRPIHQVFRNFWAGLLRCFVEVWGKNWIPK